MPDGFGWFPIGLAAGFAISIVTMWVVLRGQKGQPRSSRHDQDVAILDQIHAINMSLQSPNTNLTQFVATYRRFLEGGRKFDGACRTYAESMLALAKNLGTEDAALQAAKEMAKQ